MENNIKKYTLAYSDTDGDDQGFLDATFEASRLLEQAKKMEKTILLVRDRHMENVQEFEGDKKAGYIVRNIQNMESIDLLRALVGGDFECTLNVEIAIDDKFESVRGDGVVSSHDSPMGDPRGCIFYTSTEFYSYLKQKRSRIAIFEDMRDYFMLSDQDFEERNDDAAIDAIKNASDDDLENIILD